MSGHHHHHAAEGGDRRVLGAVLVNVLLTVAQIAGGIVSGSLSLIADAIHNLSDAMSLGIAFAARRIARRPSDRAMTFGYVRAEIVAALVNYTTLIVVGLYLVWEAVLRFLDPQPVEGWLVVVIAGVALAVDLATAALTWALSKESMNIRAAFLHNVADALGSIGVIVAGTLIILRDWQLVDPLVTLMIAAWILWQSFTEIGGVIRLLMLGTPAEIDLDELIGALRGVAGVAGLHHVHVWAIDERHTALEAHVVVADGTALGGEAVKQRIKALLAGRFGIAHTTLEIEQASQSCEGEDARLVGHRITGARG
ncbi:cation diffusion facilitator family transporter [Marinimicrococcus flavescens]|uniref:Cation diffusion facilitator family transporter n=1 Tax=Marinimicrococcus flavescens TaxID=3031815 RepID=A0AAP4D650_9PROT|nr:cation diffusion facilitator family transporter [Marinimicrococcus flavescens]